MTELSQEILERYQVRNTKKQKAAFQEFLKAKLPGLSEETGGRLVRSNNLVLGDPDHARVVFSAHYDTCTTLPVPNFLTPKNIPLYVLYNLLLCVFFFLVAGGVSFLLMRLTHIFLVAYFGSLASALLLFLLFFAGKPNPQYSERQHLRRDLPLRGLRFSYGGAAGKSGLCLFRQRRAGAVWLPPVFEAA